MKIMSLKLMSLNVEKKEHLQKVARFIERENPDAVVLLEVAKDQLEMLLTKYPYKVFKPNFRLVSDDSLIGVVLAAKVPITRIGTFYCDGLLSEEVPQEAMGVHRPVVIKGMVGSYLIYATHFTWTPKMSETKKQQTHLQYLLSKLDSEEMVLCGDFNIPRGNPSYLTLATKYRDNIPSAVKTTIDWVRHKARKQGKQKFFAVVDYVWSTPKYKVENVRVVSGVSDHCAVVCKVSRVT